MEALIIYPENKEQLTAVKAVMKAMKIAFERKKGVYPNRVIDGVKKSLDQAKVGSLKSYNGLKDMLV